MALMSSVRIYNDGIQLIEKTDMTMKEKPCNGNVCSNVWQGVCIFPPYLLDCLLKSKVNRGGFYSCPCSVRKKRLSKHSVLFLLTFQKSQTRRHLLQENKVATKQAPRRAARVRRTGLSLRWSRMDLGWWRWWWWGGEEAVVVVVGGKGSGVWVGSESSWRGEEDLLAAWFVKSC